MYKIEEIPGLQRLRFTTSHPNDFTRETIRAYRDIDVLVNHLHLPIQSGNNEVLKSMRRDHTVEEYLELIDELKSEVPGVSLTTDIIVGFPGETDAQFQDTMKIMERIGCSSSFMFSYSPRPGTPANEFKDSVPEETKRQRLQEIIQLQNRMTEEQGKTYQGKTVEVLIEGKSARPGYSLKGRNPQYWRVNAKDSKGRYQPGDMVQVRIEQTSGHGLSGIIQ